MTEQTNNDKINKLHSARLRDTGRLPHWVYLRSDDDPLIAFEPARYVSGANRDNETQTEQPFKTSPHSNHFITLFKDYFESLSFLEGYLPRFLDKHKIKERVDVVVETDYLDVNTVDGYFTTILRITFVGPDTLLIYSLCEIHINIPTEALFTKELDSTLPFSLDMNWKSMYTDEQTYNGVYTSLHQAAIDLFAKMEFIKAEAVPFDQVNGGKELSITYRDYDVVIGTVQQEVTDILSMNPGFKLHSPHYPSMGQGRLTFMAGWLYVTTYKELSFDGLALVMSTHLSVDSFEDEQQRLFVSFHTEHDHHPEDGTMLIHGNDENRFVLRMGCFIIAQTMLSFQSAVKLPKIENLQYPTKELSFVIHHITETIINVSLPSLLAYKHNRLGELIQERTHTRFAKLKQERDRLVEIAQQDLQDK